MTEEKRTHQKRNKRPEERMESLGTSSSVLCGEGDRMQFTPSTLSADAFASFERIRQHGQLCDVTLVVCRRCYVVREWG